MKNKKKLLGCISLLAFAATAAGFAGAGVSVKAAETAGEPQKANGFYMEAGASVRIDGKAGVRYQAYLSADKYAELIETPQKAGKDVKIYAVVNRADTGATLGATNAVQQEVSLPSPDENGGYTLQARVTYDELESAETIKKAAAVEISARYYIVTNGEEQSAVAADENDNSRSMRAVANAALTKGEVTENAVKNYLGEVTNVSAAGKMYVSDTQTIDLSGVIENDASAFYDTAYFGAKKVGTVANKKVTLNTPVTAEIGEELPLTLMDAANNVLNTSFVYGYTTISGLVQGASGTVTATTAGGKTFAGEITDENAYAVDVLANETYNLYFDCGSGATATDGIINGVAVQTEAVTKNLDKTYAKISVGKHGEMSGDTTTSGNWVRTANNEYTTYGTNHGDAFTIAQFGKSENFIVSARIKGGNGEMEAGFTLLTDDSVKVGNKKVENLQIFRRCDAKRKFTMYSWSVSWMKSGYLDTSVAFDENDYTMTLIKYENKLRLYVNDSYVITFEGTIQGVDISSLGSVTVGMSLRGTYTKTVKFSDWSYSADESNITAYMSAHNS